MGRSGVRSASVRGSRRSPRPPPAPAASAKAGAGAPERSRPPGGQGCVRSLQATRRYARRLDTEASSPVQRSCAGSPGQSGGRCCGTTQPTRAPMRRLGADRVERGVDTSRILSRARQVRLTAARLRPPRKLFDQVVGTDSGSWAAGLARPHTAPGLRPRQSAPPACRGCHINDRVAGHSLRRRTLPIR